MKTQAEKKRGPNPKVGNVVSLAVYKVDTVNLIPSHVITIVVVDDNEKGVRAATSEGDLNSWYQFPPIVIFHMAKCNLS